MIVLKSFVALCLIIVITFIEKVDILYNPVFFSLLLLTLIFQIITSPPSHLLPLTILSISIVTLTLAVWKKREKQ